MNQVLDSDNKSAGGVAPGISTAPGFEPVRQDCDKHTIGRLSRFACERHARCCAETILAEGIQRVAASGDDRIVAPAHHSRERRDFLTLATWALGGISVAATIWPFVDQMNPDQAVLAAGAPVEVDLKPLAPGQMILILWRSRPVFIVHRTADSLQALQQQAHIALLRDPSSEADQQGPYATNWHRSIKPEHLVLVGICTHLGCIPTFRPEVGGDLGMDWVGGYFCPCHGSKYDLAGRVYKAVPAPYNLPVPPYRYLDETTLRIGENPEGQSFDFSAIEQI